MKLSTAEDQTLDDDIETNIRTTRTGGLVSNGQSEDTKSQSQVQGYLGDDNKHLPHNANGIINNDVTDSYSSRSNCSNKKRRDIKGFNSQFDILFSNS